ncbi:uncharacterized protein IL334_001062 [Kwoniella shivajii]|uniref:Secreted protein n=1 Tax=Kwoniella shivajii TaxID=564305 RepID=A0ABZ1CQW4_9TREE|nr:hypothetical protein IL334_001062 [Kwoniella shivajii]
MKFTLGLIFITALATSVLADNYANFFTDENCNEDGSIGFDMTNPGCFSQLNMKSVYIPNNGPFAWTSNFCLVMTYGDQTCGCQNDSYEFKSSGFCHVLDGKAQSYRFISGKCDVNNC